MFLYIIDSAAYIECILCSTFLTTDVATRPTTRTGIVVRLSLFAKGEGSPLDVLREHLIRNFGTFVFNTVVNFRYDT